MQNNPNLRNGDLAIPTVHCWRLQPSRRLRLFWGFVHFPPLLFLTVIMSPIGYDWLIICVIILLNWIRVSRHQRFSSAHSYPVLRWHTGEWWLENSQGACLKVTLEAESWVQEQVAVLRFKPLQGQAVWCVILPDSLPYGQFKTLCRVLTVQAGSC